MEFVYFKTTKGVFRVPLFFIAYKNAENIAKINKWTFGDVQTTEEFNYIYSDNKEEAITWMMNNIDWDEFEKDLDGIIQIVDDSKKTEQEDFYIDCRYFWIS
jgi:hypothetical protein